MLKLEAEKIIAKKESHGYREYRIPGIIRHQENIFLAYEARAEETGDWGDIDVVVLRLSSDGELQQVLKIGQSHLPKDGAIRTYNNPTLIPDGDRIHLIYHQNYERAFIVTSENRGDSWSAPPGNYPSLPGIPLFLECLRHRARPWPANAKRAADRPHLAGQWANAG